jgi:hypothetical protein
MAVKTEIIQLPGKIKLEKIEQAISLFLERKIIVPETIGSLSKKIKVSEEPIPVIIKTIHDYLQKNVSVLISGKKKTDIGISLFLNEKLPFSGRWSHYTSDEKATEFKTDIYNDTIAELFKILPLAAAFCHNREALDFYNYRIEKREAGSEQVMNVINIGKGIAYPPWKAWYGEPYIKSMGREKLLSAPCFYRKEYKKNILICLYDKPEEWNSPSSLEMIEQFKKHIGEEYFYDNNKRERKLKTPFK